MDTFTLLNPWHSLRTLVGKSLGSDPEEVDGERSTREVQREGEENPDCLAMINNYENQRLFRFNKAIYNILMLNQNCKNY